MDREVILASASPRRRELLSTLIPEFSVVPADLDEDALTTANPWETAELLAREKCAAVFARHPHALVIAADTVVAVPRVDGYRQLAKPLSQDDAVQMLGSLSGREHFVITGVSLRSAEMDVTWAATSRVRFRQLSANEIEAYVATGEPMDKAGAYAIQGGAKEFVESTEGSISNIIGLPMEELGVRLGKSAPPVRRG